MQRKVTSTMEEDFIKLGLMSESVQEEARNGKGRDMSSDEEDDTEDDEEDYLDDEEDDDEEDDEEDMEESRGKKTKKKDMAIGKTKTIKGMKESDEEDPIDGKFVTMELFDRIKNLPFDNMKEEDFTALLDELSEKEIPEDNEELMSEAKEVVTMLKEGAANRLRRFKAGSTSRKTSFQCPQGFRAVKTGSGKGRPKCVPAHLAAGGMGALNKEARKKAKWARGGKGKMSKMRSGRVEKRRGAMRGESVSPLAAELMSLNESFEIANMTLRDEIVDRIGSIMELMSEEFRDEMVTELYEDALSNVLEMQSSGRLDEDVASDDEFLLALEPTVQLLAKSMEKIEGLDLGNA